MSKWSPDEKINQIITDAWLGIDVDEDKIFNPFDEIPAELAENPELYITWLMAQPEYLSFICSEILNVHLLPQQALILYELWNRRFPMLIGTRGLGKTFLMAVYCMLRLLLLPGRKMVVAGAAYRQSRFVFEYMQSIYNNAPILRDVIGNSGGDTRDIDVCKFEIGQSRCSFIPLGDGQKIRGLRANDIIVDEFGCLEKNTLVETDNGLIRISDCIGKDINLINKNGDLERPQNFIVTPPTEQYRIKTSSGHSFICSNIHSVLTANRGFVLAKDLTDKDYLISENKYKFPEKQILNLDENLAWLFGILTSEGAISSKYQLTVQMNDIDCIDRTENSFKLFDNSIHCTRCEREPYKDKRGWKCKKSYIVSVCHKQYRDYFEYLGLDREIAIDKKIPWSILQSPKDIVISYLSGLFEGDGSAFLWKSKENDKSIGICFYSSSKQLCEEVQVILLKLGFNSYLNHRKSKISKNPQYFVRLNGDDAKEFGLLLNIKKWESVLNECVTRSIHKGYSVRWDKSRNKYRTSVFFCGKSKCTGQFSDRLEAEEKTIQKLPPQHFKVRSVTKLDDIDNLYDFYLPETNSFYGNGFVQHNSVPREIFETVLSGFAAVKASPIESVKMAASVKKAKELGLYQEQESDKYTTFVPNQIIISGTADYDFQTFASYWKRWKAIIGSKGDMAQLAGTVSTEEAYSNLNWKDYSIIRIPFELAPPGFMDEAIVARSRATMNKGVYDREFGAVFSKDSTGYYRRSLLEACTVKKDTDWSTMPAGSSLFQAVLTGDSRKTYVFSVDPASEVDNFSISIIELHETHRRIVYLWVTNAKEHAERIRKKLSTENDYYSYCCRKLRDLMKTFPCERLVIDGQGGGKAIIEGLHDKDKMESGEQQLWHVIDPDERRDSDGYSGQHIIIEIKFANADWTTYANTSLRKDFEDKVLLFPYFDPITLSFSSIEDEKNNRIYDTLEDCVMNIEELKNELTTIVMTTTAGNRDRWDTPEYKLPGGKKGRMRKDRYSALLMANSVARQLQRAIKKPIYVSEGGFATTVGIERTSGGRDFEGPSWFTEKMANVY